MVKLYVKFDDGSKITYTIKKKGEHLIYQYAARHPNAQSIVLQRYPKKDNDPVMLKGEAV